MTRQRYSVRESLNRILRILKGSPLPTDAPETITGEVLSKDEALSDIAELLAGSLPGEYPGIPDSILTRNYYPEGLSGSAFWIAPTVYMPLAGTIYTAMTVEGVAYVPQGSSGTLSSFSSLRVIRPTVVIPTGTTINYLFNLYVEGYPSGASYGNWNAYFNRGPQGFGGNNLFNGTYSITPTNPVDIYAGTMRQRESYTPASTGSSGYKGQICWDADYIYVCINTNTWKRAGLSFW